MIMCLVKEKGTNEHSIYTSSDFFINDVQKVFDKAIGFVSAGEYTVVAVPQEGDELRAYVTVDGKTFAEAKLPAELKKGKQQASLYSPGIRKRRNISSFNNSNGGRP